MGSELYKQSHQSYDVGEMVDRNYDWSVFTRDSKYGVATPHDNSGVGVRRAMQWITAGQEYVLSLSLTRSHALTHTHTHSLTLHYGRSFPDLLQGEENSHCLQTSGGLQRADTPTAGKSP